MRRGRQHAGAGEVRRADQRADAHRPFEELRRLVRKPARGSPSAAARASANPAPAEPDDASGTEELALFRDAMGGVHRLRDDNRKQLERPKPPPVVRPRPAEPEPEAGPTRARAPASDSEAFAEAMRDVSPLAPDGRVEPDHQSMRNLPEDFVAWEAADPADPAAPLDDDALLGRAFAGVKPLADDNRVELEPPRRAPEPIMRHGDDQDVLRESLETPLSFEDRLDIGDEAVFLRPGLPRRVLADLRRGRWVLQRELDLHGLNREQAREELSAFLARCLREGLRCVRLIHGKGLGSPGRVGILGQLSRGWLAQREEILAFCQAKPFEGGSGALLILLRARTAGERANPG